MWVSVLFGTLLPIVLLGFGIRAFARRSRSFHSRLADLLGQCVTDEILTASQKDKILAREAEGRSGVRIRGTTWIAILAGLFVVAGVSLLIAHNWDRIGPITRVIGYLVLFGAVGEAAIRFEKTKLAVSVPFTVLWFFLPILGIGLYAQTFQISGDPVRPFYAWAVITLPMAWMIHRKILAPIHLLLLFGTVFGGSFSPDTSFSLLKEWGYSREAEPSVLAWMVAVIGLGWGIFESERLLPKAHRRHVYGIALLWLVFLVAAPTALQIKNGGWLFVAATAASTLWLAVHLLLKSEFHERVLSYVAVVGCVYAMTFLWHADSKFEGDVSPYGLMLVCAMAAIGAIIFIMRGSGAFSPHANWNRSFQILFFVPLALSLVLPHVSGDGLKFVAIGANLLLFGGAVAAMWHGAMIGSNMRINLGVSVLILVLITRFIDVLGSFIEGGLGFIAAGLFLGLIAYGLSKARRHLIEKAQAEVRK